ncbi:winged helix-turn-helix domain-containing protein, partial [Serratia marcescens]|uniref:winged helix-turn-helix domain-containing protein n=1 Tax=Serratia marcescens TaxID=615 RepID=UPI002577AEBC
MKYIINLSYVFDIQARTLSLKNDSNLSITLSKPATRLLCELIANNNTTINRVDIIKSVWTDYGFTPSTASLNNHISELRKAFETIGLDKEIIITVPRTGFRMEAEIHPVLKSEDKIDKSKHVQQDIKDENKSLDTPTKNISIKQKKTRTKTGAFLTKKNILIVIILLILTFLFVYLTNKQKIKSTELIFTKEKCGIYSVERSLSVAEITDRSTDIMNNIKIDCKERKADLYYTEARPANKLKVLLLIH